MRSMADYDMDFQLDPFGRKQGMVKQPPEQPPMYETPPILPPLMQEGARPSMTTTFPPLGPPPPETMPVEQANPFMSRPQLGQPLAQPRRRTMGQMSQGPINGDNYLNMLSQARQGLRFRR